MKGITPVIAIILLLLITISMVGFAFVWFSRVSQEAGSSISAGINQTIVSSEQKVRIDGVSGTAVTLRSTGSQNLPTGSVALLVNGQSRTSSCPSSSQAPGSVFACTLTSSCTAGNTLRATAPGNSDEITC